MSPSPQTGRTNWTRHFVVGLAVIGAIVIVIARPRMAQSLAYHNMADQRSWLGIPNFLNVVSNFPFAVMGLLGLAAIFNRSANETALFKDQWERWPYAVLFAGVVLTTFGSGYYHLAPDNTRLVWDRLPMTLGFMGLLTAVVAERVTLRLARVLFLPLLAVGAASVAYWYWTELHGVGDLRFYLLVQFGSLLLVVLLLALYPARYPGAKYLVIALVAYSVAKIFESADAPIFAMGQIVSGHTLKHLVAAAGVGFIVVMLRSRPGRSVSQTIFGSPLTEVSL